MVQNINSKDLNLLGYYTRTDSWYSHSTVAILTKVHQDSMRALCGQYTLDQEQTKERMRLPGFPQKTTELRVLICSNFCSAHRFDLFRIVKWWQTRAEHITKGLEGVEDLDDNDLGFQVRRRQSWQDETGQQHLSDDHTSISCTVLLAAVQNRKGREDKTRRDKNTTVLYYCSCTAVILAVLWNGGGDACKYLPGFRYSICIAVVHSPHSILYIRYGIPF